jgi:hypothetical protein
MIDLNLRMAPEMGYDIQLITVDEIKSVLNRVSPFKNKDLKINDIIGYLEKSNNKLFERQNEVDHLKDLYIMEVAILSVVDPLIQLNIPEKIRNSFLNIVAKSPYKIDKPLDFYINKDGIIYDDNHSLYEIRNPIKSFKNFQRNKNLHQKLKQEVNDIAMKLQKKYNEVEHLEFVGYYNFCSELFGLNMHKDKLLDLTNTMLAQDHGVFGIKLPDFLNETE